MMMSHASSLSSTTFDQKKQTKKKVDVHLFATNALVIFWNKVSATPLQQHLLQHRFSTTFVALLQHAYATLSSVATLQHCFCNTMFCNITFALE
jgi:predicted thioesterase